MWKPIIISISVLPLLSACFISRYLDYRINESENSRWIKEESLSDTLIAVGKPVQQVAGFENAMLLAGKKRAYLVRPQSSERISLPSILAQTDLTYLKVLPNRLPPGKQEENFAVISSDVKSTLGVKFQFFKPKKLLKAGEQAQMERLGFNCRDYDKDLLCTTSQTLELQTVTLNNRNHLQHTFRQPLPLVFYRYEAKKGTVSRGLLKALLPLTMAVDVVTFPIQLIGAVHVIGKNP
ncbi:hypothetical protein [Neisseria sp. CCUG12390]|uniref:hypothetical protein n=1 Tax=Neisseria sp. CCUG12390 TaxID=3392035 RepID=UPI003A10332A